MQDKRREIVAALGSTIKIDVASEIERRIKFLVEYALSIKGCAGFVLGISGGQDSTLAGKLGQLAAERLREVRPEAKFYAVRLPYGQQFDESDAQLALEFINPDEQHLVQIKGSVDALVTELEEALGVAVSDFNKGNVKARVRMTAQYAIAGDRNLLVIGSDHAAEAITGFFTKFGDGAADIMPLAGLTKGQGAEMLQHLEADERLWQKVPTADLLDEKPGETDETALGVSYEEIDSYLTEGVISDQAREIIEGKYEGSRHKRNMPVGPDDDWWR